MKIPRRTVLKLVSLLMILEALAGCGTLGGKNAKAQKQPGYGWLTVTSMPEGIKLFFNGKYIYDENGNALETPVTTRLEAGTYVLSLGLYEYQTWRDTVKIAARETSWVKVPLVKEFTEESYQKQEKMALTSALVIGSFILLLGIVLRNVQFK